MYHLDVARWVQLIFFCNEALKQLIYEWYCYLQKEKKLKIQSLLFPFQRLIRN